MLLAPMQRHPSGHTVLDIFLLALIREGVDTLYALREQAGLSLGATQPAVQRLTSQGLLVRQPGGSRGKQTYALTAAGKKLTGTEWARMASSAPNKPLSDAASVLRLIAMADKGDRQLALALLDRALADRKKRGKLGPRFNAKAFRNAKTTAEKYRLMSMLLDCGRALSEKAVFAAIRSALLKSRK